MLIAIRTKVGIQVSSTWSCTQHEGFYRKAQVRPAQPAVSPTPGHWLPRPHVPECQAGRRHRPCTPGSARPGPAEGPRLCAHRHRHRARGGVAAPSLEVLKPRLQVNKIKINIYIKKKYPVTVGKAGSRASGRTADKPS